MKKTSIAPYLRALRRRSALSQLDVAFLLGSFTAARVSRHETGLYTPPLDIVLAYEVIYGVTIAAIYEDDSIRITKDIRRRAQLLYDSLAHRKRDPFRKEKRAVLKKIIERCSTH